MDLNVKYKHGCQIDNICHGDINTNAYIHGTQNILL